MSTHMEKLFGRIKRTAPNGDMRIMVVPATKALAKVHKTDQPWIASASSVFGYGHSPEGAINDAVENLCIFSLRARDAALGPPS